MDLISQALNIKVLFIGDTIIDEYVYVAPLGKAAKENIIAVKHQSVERFEGGVLAAARHAKELCGIVHIHTANPHIVKRRYVDQVYFRKLFEVHAEENDGSIAGIPRYADYDVIAIADFGHGAVTRKMIGDLVKSTHFIAVCAQTNSANHGFNLITKYARANYVVIDEPEARLAAHDRESPIEDVMRAIGGNYGKLIVTHGMHGAYGLDSTGFYHCPALTETVVDTMGAGDAFFAMTAPLAPFATMPELLMIGNAAGAVKTQIVGHRKCVSKTALKEMLKKCLV